MGPPNSLHVFGFGGDWRGVGGTQAALRKPRAPLAILTNWACSSRQEGPEDRMMLGPSSARDTQVTPVMLGAPEPHLAVLRAEPLDP